MVSFERTCCVTGHRSLPVWQIDEIKESLAEQVDKAILDGFVRFYSGFADGADLFFAKIVADRIKAGARITLEAAVPDHARYLRLMKDSWTRGLIESCSQVHIFSPSYNLDAYHMRNRYMIHNSARVIAVYDGRETGGTHSTLMHARNTGTEIINVYKKPEGPGQMRLIEEYKAI